MSGGPGIPDERSVPSAHGEMTTDDAPPAGKSKAIEEIFKANADFVWRVLRRLGLSDGDAEDAAQEVFLIVYRRLGEYEERGAVRAWLFTISRQVASHYRRSAARRDRKARAMMEVVPAPEDPHELALRAEAVAEVQGFLGTLGEDQAMVFYLTEIEGMTAPEVAAALDVKLNTIYGRLRLARQRFERMLSERKARQA